MVDIDTTKGPRRTRSPNLQLIGPAATHLCIGGSGCFVEDMMVLRRFPDESCRPIPIEQVEVGQQIWGRDGWTVIRAAVAKGPLEYAEIHLDNGRTPMSLTLDHKVYIYDVDSILNPGETRVHVRDLIVGDRLLQPKDIQWIGDHISWSAPREAHVQKIVPREEKRPCYAIETSDHYVYLPEHDVTVSNCDDLSVKETQIDLNEVLRKAREAALACRDISPAAIALVEAFEALDEALSWGATLPDAWAAR